MNSRNWQKIPLEQWSAFIAVVEEGSFARAAEALHKSQSAISYALAHLEERLPVPVLQLQGRKAVMTAAGEVMYRRAKQLVNLANDVEQTAQCLAQGWETKLTIAVDAIVPMEPVLQAMCRFGDKVPHTRVALLETALSGTDEALLERRADMAVCANIPPGFLATPIGEVSKIAVAHVSHPLARSEHPLTEQDLRQSRQIVVSDSGIKRSQDSGWLEAEQRFTVSHFATSLKALEQGLGFAFMPYAVVATAIDEGRLKRLNLETNSEQRIPLYLVNVGHDYLGPALKAFSEEVVSCFKVHNKEMP